MYALILTRPNTPSNSMTTESFFVVFGNDKKARDDAIDALQKGYYVEVKKYNKGEQIDGA